MAVGLGQVGHAPPLWEILPQQAVGVLVGATLPTMMRGGEGEARGGLLFDRRVVMEFRPVVPVIVRTGRGG